LLSALSAPSQAAAKAADERLQALNTQLAQKSKTVQAVNTQLAEVAKTVQALRAQLAAKDEEGKVGRPGEGGRKEGV
jgi:uncharacterized coiled-coil protein SlyX